LAYIRTARKAILDSLQLTKNESLDYLREDWHEDIEKTRHARAEYFKDKDKRETAATKATPKPWQDTLDSLRRKRRGEDDEPLTY
jgi:hypothetical protein